MNGKRTTRQPIEATGRPEMDVRNVPAGPVEADLTLKERDSGDLDRIVSRVSGDGGVRFAALTLLGRLILKTSDGARSPKALFADLGVAEQRLLEDSRLLVRHGRTAFSSGAEENRTYVESARGDPREHRRPLARLRLGQPGTFLDLANGLPCRFGARYVLGEKGRHDAGRRAGALRPLRRAGPARPRGGRSPSRSAPCAPARRPPSRRRGRAASRAGGRP